jgi:hypothetical protein
MRLKPLNTCASVAGLCRPWQLSHSFDPRGVALYERHYSCRPRRNARPRLQFVGPGEKVVLITQSGDAVLVWLGQRYRMDGQAGVSCAVFRNESRYLSSYLISAAMALAWKRWPGERLFTYVNPRRVRSANPGFCFLQAGWRRGGTSRGGLVLLEAVPRKTR